MSDNGLLTSSDVYRTASTDSSYFVKKGEPIVSSSPLQIVSANGANVLTLSEANSGTATIETTAGAIVLGGSTSVATVVQVGGTAGTGRVYDEIYNRPQLAEVLNANNSAGSNQINMNSRKIINLGTPTDSTDATTKAYVDGLALTTTAVNNFFNYNDPGNASIIQSVLPGAGGGAGQISLAPGVYQFSAFWENVNAGTTYIELDTYWVQNGTGTEIPFSRTRLSPQTVSTLYNMVSSPFTITTAGLYNFVIAMDGAVVTDPSTPGLWTSDIFGYCLTKFA
jgi:hypothetical protein